MKHTPISLFLISLALLLSSCNRQTQHDIEVFNYILHKLNLSIPEQPHNYIFITKDGCTACKAFSMAYAKMNDSDTVTFITTPQLQDFYELDASPYVVIDSTATIERLNWSLGGIIEVTTSNRQVVRMQDYDINNYHERFGPILNL